MTVTVICQCPCEHTHGSPVWIQKVVEVDPLTGFVLHEVETRIQHQSGRNLIIDDLVVPSHIYIVWPKK